MARDHDILTQMRAQLIRDLLGRHEQDGAAIFTQQGVTEREGAEFQIRAAYVEQPCQGSAVAQQRRILPGFGQLGANARALGGGAFARITLRIGQSRRQRQGGAVRPNRVDQIRRDRHHLHAGEAGQTVRANGPGIEADPFGRRGLAQPVLGLVFDDVAALPQCAIRLLLKLQGVAAIGEYCCAFGQHDGKPRRAGEPADPGQSFRTGRYIFAQIFIGARNDVSVQPQGGEAGA